MFGRTNDTGLLGLLPASEKLFQQLVCLLPDTSKRLQLRQVHVSRTMLARFQTASQTAPQSHTTGGKGRGGTMSGGKGRGKCRGKGVDVGAERRPGDWDWSCGALCLESKDSCYRCHHAPRGSTTKPQGPTGGGGGGGGFSNKRKGKSKGKGKGGRMEKPREGHGREGAWVRKLGR
jgi:hypothetical protein